MNIFRPQRKRRPNIHRFMFFEAPVDLVSRELITWGEASWWPQDCLWKYIRETDGPVNVGTKYRIKINKPSASDWEAEVTQLLPDRVVERTFTKGMFGGFERIMIEEKANGTRIDYELYFTIRGALNLLLWPLVLRGQYLKTINAILGALKVHIDREVQRLQAEHGRTS